MKHIFENMYDAGGATRVALPKAWATFKNEWQAEYDRRAMIRGANAAERQAARKAQPKAKREPETFEGEVLQTRYA